jgi:hypothetical protein
VVLHGVTDQVCGFHREAGLPAVRRSTECVAGRLQGCVALERERSQKAPARRAADISLDRTWDSRSVSRSEPADILTSPSRRLRDLGRTRLFDRLPGTCLEGEPIAGRLDATAWPDGEALEARLRDVHSPRVLNMATHGLFLEDQERAADPWPIRSPWPGSGPEPREQGWGTRPEDARYAPEP